jgi:predicted nucleic acid-binding protein
MNEYKEVLKRPKFGFSKNEIDSLIDWIEGIGRSVVAQPCDKSFIDEADKKFYEVACYCHAKLITVNLKHFPDDPDVLSVSEFLEFYEKRKE